MTKTMTPRTQLDKAVKAYIIEAIGNDGYDDLMSASYVGVGHKNGILEDDENKLRFLYNTFKSEYGFEVARRGEQGAFCEWLKGLPSAINIAFTNYDILQLAIKWGYYGATLTEKQEEKILDNYWNLITVKTFQLFRKYEVN